MATRKEITLSGIGRLVDVCDALSQDCPNSESMRSAISSAFIALDMLITQSDRPEIADAIACAVLNRYYEKRGWLTYLGDKGSINYDFHSTDNARKILVALLND